MRSLRMVEVYVFNFGRWMAPAAPIVISTIGRPSFFSMRLSHFGCHRTDRFVPRCLPLAQGQVYRVASACLAPQTRLAKTFETASKLSQCTAPRLALQKPTRSTRPSAAYALWI